MRKFTLLLLVLCMSSFPQFLQAQEDYAVNSSIANANLSPSRIGKRYCKGVSLTPQKSNVAYGAKQTISFNEGIEVSSSSDNGPNYKIYNDLTATSDGLSLKTGQTVNGSFAIGNRDGVWDGYWMGSYIYIDANQNKIFDTSSELVRSSGSTYNSSNVVNTVSEFRLPTTAGQYRMRFIIAWPAQEQFNSLPAGYSGMSDDGGCITDVTLNLVDPVVSVSNNDAKGTVTLPGAAICGNDYSFTVEAKAGYSVTSVVARCGENLDEADSENVTWKAITPTNSGNTYTVSGADFQGDMKIIVTYTLNTDVELIKQGKQVFRLKNRKYTASPYLKVAKSDVNGTERPYNVGEAILYHVDETMANAAGASCLWRLIPVSGGSNQYYLRSQNANASDLHSGGDYPIKMTESDGSALYLVQSGSYYGLGTSNTTSNTVFLHAVEFGMNNQDGANKYVATSNGYYVTTWNFTSTTEASQWTFEAVDEIGITIGASGYASVNYDFPVKFPAGVKVYKKAEEAATYIRLEEITPGTDGCVSLHTGNAAFVAGTEGASITLSILSDEPDNIDTGVNGTYLATKFEEGDAANIYGIAKVNDVVAFYKMQGGTTIKQNKGYIRSTSSNAPRMELTFGEGETTGIESVLEDNSRRESIDTSVLYDLNGRRVLYPSRGIYVTASGQRIFLK